VAEKVKKESESFSTSPMPSPKTPLAGAAHDHPAVASAFGSALAMKFGFLP
jgi:hypothetical protein